MSPHIGTTFSHLQAKSYGLDPEQALSELIEANLAPIRLCAYWSELEITQSEFNFEPILSLLDICQEKNVPVVLCMGMKAPRWPEFYIPKWLETKSITQTKDFLFIFLKKILDQTKKFSCITHYQVENEPLDPSGPKNLKIPLDLLTEEVSLIRSIDPSKKILLTAWGNTLSKRQTLPQLNQLADVVGLDLYYKVPWSFLGGIFHGYSGPADSQYSLKQLIHKNDKPVWITELQAEPWETSPINPLSDTHPSISPRLLSGNLENAHDLGIQTILLWGSEYWLSLKNKSLSRMWHSVAKLTRV